MRKHKSSFDSKAAAKRSKGISKEKYQMKLAYEALKKENDEKIATMEKEAEDKHRRGKKYGMIGGLLQGAMGAGISSGFNPAVMAGGGLIGAFGGYHDAANNSSMMPMGMDMLRMKLAMDLAEKDPRNKYKATDPTEFQLRPPTAASPANGLDVNTALKPIDPGLGSSINPAQAQLTPMQRQQQSFKKNLASLMAVDTTNLPPIPGPHSRQPIRGQ